MTHSYALRLTPARLNFIADHPDLAPTYQPLPQQPAHSTQQPARRAQWQQEWISWAVPPHFVSCRTFLGARRGYVYKTGESGLGYYLDPAPPAISGDSRTSSIVSNSTDVDISYAQSIATTNATAPLVVTVPPTPDRRVTRALVKRCSPAKGMLTRRCANVAGGAAHLVDTPERAKEQLRDFAELRALTRGHTDAYRPVLQRKFGFAC
jgi:hypothetical protein